MNLRLNIDEPWPFVALVMVVMLSAVIAVWIHAPKDRGPFDD